MISKSAKFNAIFLFFFLRPPSPLSLPSPLPPSPSTSFPLYLLPPLPPSISSSFPLFLLPHSPFLCKSTTLSLPCNSTSLPLSLPFSFFFFPFPLPLPITFPPSFPSLPLLPSLLSLPPFSTSLHRRCDMKLEASGTFEASFTTKGWAQYAHEKLSGFEYPPGRLVTVCRR